MKRKKLTFLVFLNFVIIGKLFGAIFNLIGTNRSITATPFHSIEGAPYQKCFSVCHYSPQCFSFEVSRSSTFTGCLFYRQSYHESMTLLNKPGVTYHSLRIAKDCTELYQQGKRTNGVYEIYILGIYRKQLYCEMEIAGGGWMVFQRRFDGSIDFYNADWDAYKEGFGDASGEYWLGNKWLNLLTTSEKYDYLVWAKAFDGDTRMKKMLGVRVENEDEGFKITFEQETQDYSPNELYGMERMNGAKFSTVDTRNDVWSNAEGCAFRFGPWWHLMCHRVAMNGRYSHNGVASSEANGIIWHDWKGYWTSLKESQIMIRPRSFNP
ncbi:microfibril-associated glycoprotein 4-like [Clytia hemisphaerica]|eukprot:TCONS_00009157-protein